MKVTLLIITLCGCLTTKLLGKNINLACIVQKIRKVTDMSCDLNVHIYNIIYHLMFFFDPKYVRNQQIQVDILCIYRR